MANLKIEIADNGTKTLLTAGKYCDKNIEVEVNVAGGGGGGADIEPFVLTGDCDYACAGALASAAIELFGDKVSTNDITNAASMFYYSELVNIPFALNFKATTKASMANMFENAMKLEEIPAINNAYPKTLTNLFACCYNIRYLPEDLGVNWNWNEIQTYNYASATAIFSSCYSLRKIPEYFLGNLWGVQTSSTYSPYKYMINCCYSLDEINNIGIAQSTLTSNCFTSTFYKTYRLKNATFATNEDGTAKTANWKSQTIDMSSNIGWTDTESYLLNFNSGITKDDLIKSTNYSSLAEYTAAMASNPNWYTTQYELSRYALNSAIATINSLPDTSAYLASAGGTNTIKFKGAQGSGREIDGVNQRISNLTAEQIAVATAKGWTVSLV